MVGGTEVQVAVLEAQVFVGVGFFFYLKGQNFAAVKDNQLLYRHFNFSGGHFGVDH